MLIGVIYTTVLATVRKNKNKGFIWWGPENIISIKNKEMNAFLSICKIISYLFPVSGSSATSVQTHILSPSSNAALFSPHFLSFHSNWQIHPSGCENAPRFMSRAGAGARRVGAVFGAAASLEIGRRWRRCCWGGSGGLKVLVSKMDFRVLKYPAVLQVL